MSSGGGSSEPGLRFRHECAVECFGLVHRADQMAEGGYGKKRFLGGCRGIG